MAVSKELLARYKELKAQGINITLSELKAQLAAEETNTQSSTNEITTETVYTPEPAQTEYEVQNKTQSPWTTNYYSKPSETQTVRNVETYTHSNSYLSNSYTGYSNNFETQTNIQTNSIQTSSLESYCQSTPIYEQQTVSQTYSGNINTTENIDNSTYTNNFNADFSWEKTSPEPQTQPASPQPQTENIPTFSSFMPQVTTGSEQPIATENTPTKFCLIGYPLGHSLSSYIHNAGFKSLGLDYQYEILETPPEDLVDRIKYMKYNNFAGFNVTIPLKLPVTLFLDEIDSSADVIGAVNTVVIRPDKTLKGYNTDVIGFRNAIPHDFTLAGKVAGVLGSGGAARAAITALAQNQVKEIKIFTRNVPNTLELLNFLRSKFPNIEFNAFQIERIRDLSDINILVNATPIGMQGRSADMTPVEENELRTLPQGALVYDVIYNPKKTILLKLAEKYGYRTINGVDMFIHQAVAAEQIWTGKTPDFKDMKIAALENL